MLSQKDQAVFIINVYAGTKGDLDQGGGFEWSTGNNAAKFLEKILVEIVHCADDETPL